MNRLIHGAEQSRGATIDNRQNGFTVKGTQANHSKEVKIGIYYENLS